MSGLANVVAGSVTQKAGVIAKVMLAAKESSGVTKATVVDGGGVHDEGRSR